MQCLIIPLLAYHELLSSSTSSDICELWNGVGLVRVVGSPSIVELIYQDQAITTGSDLPDSAEVHTLESARQCGLFVLPSGHARSEKAIALNRDPNDRASSSPRRLESSTSHQRAPPNISLNVSGGYVNYYELVLVAVIGAFLQSGALIYDGFITYRSQIRLESRIHSYAFPFTLFGTVGVVLGTFICAAVIETSTDEETWEAKCSRKNSLRTVWLQKGQIVGDQVFRSFAIYDNLNRQRIRTSRKSPDLKKLEFWTLSGSVLTVTSKLNGLFGSCGLSY